MVLHTVRRLAHVSAIVAAAIATSLSVTAHAAGGTTENTSLAYDVSNLMGSGSLSFSPLSLGTLTAAPIVASGNSTQTIERFAVDLSTGTLFGYLESGGVVSLSTGYRPSLSPVPAPSTSTPPSVSIGELPALDLSLIHQYDSLLVKLPDPPLFVWQNASGMMQSTISLDVSPIPETSSVALMALGLAGMGLLNLRRNR